MTEQAADRTARIQARMRRMMPLYDSIGLQVDQIGPEVRCTAPLNAHNANHFGVMHAGVIFTLAEATGGLAVTQHRELTEYLFLARCVDITYRRMAKGAVTAVASFDEERLRTALVALESAGKFNFDQRVEVLNSEGELVTECACRFQLVRKPPIPA